MLSEYFDAIWKTYIATKSLGPLFSEFFGSAPAYFASNIMRNVVLYLQTFDSDLE